MGDRRIHVVALVVLLVAAACSGGDGTTSTTAATGTTAAPTATAASEPDLTVLRVPFVGSEGGVIDDATFQPLFASFPELELIGFELGDGFIEFTIEGVVSTEACSAIFEALGAAPDCASPGAAPSPTDAGGDGVVELRIPFDVPADAEFDTSGLANDMGPILGGYPGVEIVSVELMDGHLIFVLAGPVPVELCDDLFNAFGAIPECADLLAGGPAPGGGPDAPGGDFPPPDLAAANSAVTAMLDSVVVVTSNGQSVGSGFFFTDDGYILTNRHVVEGKSSLGVILFGGTTMSAQLVGLVSDDAFGGIKASAAPDIAVLKVSGSGYPAVDIGDPESVTYGDVVIELGHPGGYGYWMATGGHYLGLNGGDFVTTAAGDVGHSGSPMFTDNGEVVALLWGATSGSEGIVDFELNPPAPASSIDIVWSYEEFQSLSPTRPNTAGVPIDLALQYASLIIERGGDVVPSDVAGVDATVEGTTLLVPTPIDPETFGIPEFLNVINEFLAVASTGSTALDMSFAPDGTAAITFDAVPSADIVDQVVQLLVGTFGTANHVDLSNVGGGSFDSPPEDGAIEAVAASVLDSVVALTFPFGSHATGFFISEDGYILTNAHNVAGDPDAPITVVLSDGTQLPAELVGYDLGSSPDVAVLDVEGSGYPVVEIGDPDAVAPGDTTFVVGHPGGIGFWVVSAGDYVGELVGDVQENSVGTEAIGSGGNSGSPIFDSDGRVIALLWGSSPASDLPVERNVDEVLFSAAEFWSYRMAVTAGNEIDVALATANQIIATNGNVP